MEVEVGGAEGEAGDVKLEVEGEAVEVEQVPQVGRDGWCLLRG